VKEEFEEGTNAIGNKFGFLSNFSTFVCQIPM
jgi:hypothetical protein